MKIYRVDCSKWSPLGTDNETWTVAYVSNKSDAIKYADFNNLPIFNKYGIEKIVSLINELGAIDTLLELEDSSSKIYTVSEITVVDDVYDYHEEELVYPC